MVDGVIRYAVDKIPSDQCASEGITRYVNVLVEDEREAYLENLKSTRKIRGGHIIEEHIAKFRKRRGQS